jgi:Icc-related predicted phosphoesterase
LATRRLFFATDIHGSEKCFLKFVNAAKFYKAQAIVLGGDVTGKVIVPLVKYDNEYRATFRGLTRTAKDENEAAQLEKEIRFTGYYPYRTNPDEMQRLQSEAAVHPIFLRLMLETLEQWIRLAEERLRGSGVEMYMTGGNDDVPEIKSIIRKSDYVIDPEGEVVNIFGRHEMISLGFSNPTPWKTPRECSEEELWSKIQDMTSRVKDMKNCIFNFHVPPIDSGLDAAPKLDADLTPVYEGTELVTISAGSSSVRKAIEQCQPLLGLHGHIHESRGFMKIGRTLCINPGSESSEGILHGVMVDVKDDGSLTYTLTQG